MGRARKMASRGIGPRHRDTVMRGTKIVCFFFGFAAVWALVSLSFYVGEVPTDPPGPLLEQQIAPCFGSETNVEAGDSLGLSDLRCLFELGVENPGELARLLEEEDPLNVSVESPEDFVCPPKDERFSEPDLRDHQREKDFKEGKGFVYYQHLRKAGGTGFCEMASRNMDRDQVPRYHCMPDNKGALATPPWSKQEYLLSQISDKGYRIVANEWDAFPAHHLHFPGAVFATTMRHPVDRWYSQYRFEHVEHRDGSEGTPKPFQTWYRVVKKYVMGDNYYVKTFSGTENLPDHVLTKNGQPLDLSWSYRKFDSWGQKVDWRNFKQAVDILAQFNLLLILDFVNDEMWTLHETLGWHEARKQVLPHEQQAKRQNKKSIPAREALQPPVWKEALEANVFDLLLFHWGKRMYLERSACHEGLGAIPNPYA